MSDDVDLHGEEFERLELAVLSDRIARKKHPRWQAAKEFLIGAAAGFAFAASIAMPVLLFTHKHDAPTPPATAAAPPVTLYVQQDGGSDDNDCTSLASPCLTVQGAVNHVPRVVDRKTTVHISPGIFSDSEQLWGPVKALHFTDHGAVFLEGEQAVVGP